MSADSTASGQIDRDETGQAPSDRATAAFVAEHGYSPDSVWSAPGRVNLIGEHTDYNDGFVLPFALPHRTAVAVAPRTDGRMSVATVGGDGGLRHGGPITLTGLSPGSEHGWAAYPAGVAWALQEDGVRLTGADLVIAGDVPTGAGLSSSAALECAVALALLSTTERDPEGADAPNRSEIALWAQRAENEFAGAPTGLLDQTASLRCTPAHALFFDVRTGATQQVPFDTAAGGLELLVIDTRVQHSHSESGYGDRRRGCHRAADMLGVPALRDIDTDGLDAALTRLPSDLHPLVRHVVTENERVTRTVELLLAGDVPAIGPALTRSHTSLRDDFAISCAELDVAVDTALATGALGARMVGGGFGGSAIALVRSEHRSETQRAIRDAFRRRSFAAPRLFTAVPSAGAGRDR